MPASTEFLEKFGKYSITPLVEFQKSRYSGNIGNILSDGTNTYTWKNGKQLATVTRNGATWTNTYDANGLRTERSNGSTTYTYTYDGSTLSQMTVGSNALIFTYGINGQPMSVNYNGTEYYYITNAQGDVVGILNSSGTEVVTYTYDAWGNILSTTGSMASSLGLNNPLRYRGYVYDQETGLYYLQSRYYNPAICRFISADGVGYLGADSTIQSYNLFAYCNNNPVNYVDPSGEFAISAFFLKAAVIIGKALLGAAINTLTTFIAAKATSQDYSSKDAGIAAISGALGTGGILLKVLAGVISGGYSGYSAYQNGASAEGSFVAGFASAWGTTVSVSNIAGWSGAVLKLFDSTFVDLVFGMGANSVSAGIYKMVTDNSTSTHKRYTPSTFDTILVPGTRIVFPYQFVLLQ